jgi:hypothetical protein
MPELTTQVVNRYIDSARAFATSETERRIIQLASDLNSPQHKERRDQ